MTAVATCVYTRSLEELSQADAATCGAKAANLGEMTRLGLPVPAGFCVTTEAYIAHVAGAPPLHDAATILARPMDRAIVADVLAAYRQLDSPAVAVRSSATAEDLPGASFAGQQDTFLDVRGEADLILAIQRCWASLWSARAAGYRRDRAIDDTGLAMGVVVQRMVPADAAGVILTVDPISGADDLVIEAAPGLGDRLVSGEVRGDVYRVHRRPALAVAEQKIRNPEHPVLDRSVLLDISRLALRLERHFGKPQDVEFALRDGFLHLLQARPMTALPATEIDELPVVAALGPAEQRALAKIAERYPCAPKPLDNLSLTVLSIESAIHAFRVLGFRVSTTAEAAAVEQMWREVFLLPPLRASWRLLGLPLRLRRLWNRDWSGWWAGEPRQRLIDVSRDADLTALSDGELVSRLDAIVSVWRDVMKERCVGTFSMYAAEYLVKALVAFAVGKERSLPVVADLLANLPTRTLAVNDALWELSRAARANPRPGDPVLLGKMSVFLDEYGHREGKTFYLSTPTWRRDPAQVWTLVRGLARLESLPARAGSARYDAARARVIGRLRRVPGLPRLFGWIVDRYRLLQIFEEDSHFDMTRPLDALQSIAAECGRRLVDRRMLSNASEVFYLTCEEMRGRVMSTASPDAGWRSLIARREATYRVVNARWVARLFESAQGGPIRFGSAASGGIARGRARIVRDESEFGRLQQGEILVCPCSNPAWTPLFATAAGVVSETGGVASHAAIVAREYGIPAVLGVAGATQQIVDGQDLLVDGDTGRVVLGERPAASDPEWQRG